MTAAHFTKDNPCTKVEIFNCFYRSGQWVSRPLVEAKAEIGHNVPKYLIREGFVAERLSGGVDYYVLTEVGKAWLHKGILRYLEIHPERIADCREAPPGYTKGAHAALPLKFIRRSRQGA